MMRCDWVRDRIQAWLRDYDCLQSVAVKLLYVQIGCGLIGSLGASYNGVSVVNLGVSLFALVAIESSSQILGRTYAALLLCSILMDVFWLALFSRQIWNISSEKYESFFIFSVKLTLAMQIIGFCVRLSSSLLWIQMYRLGASREGDLDLRSSFLSPPAPSVARQSSGSDEVLGGSIYDPSYFSSLFEDGRENNRFSIRGQNHGIGASISDVSPRKLSLGRSFQCVDNHGIGGIGSASSADTSPLKLSMGRSHRSVDEENPSGQAQPFRI